jgi:hypothetical protein
MVGAGSQILKAVAKTGEIPLLAALLLPKATHRNHLDQYALALLIEEGYVGCTINYSPPEGFEEMLEFALAITLHMFTLQAGEDGFVTYLGIRSSGSIKPEK